MVRQTLIAIFPIPRMSGDSNAESQHSFEFVDAADLDVQLKLQVRHELDDICCQMRDAQTT